MYNETQGVVNSFKILFFDRYFFKLMYQLAGYVRWELSGGEG
jgi:hypothetical protein